MMTEATVALIEYLHNMGLDKDVDLLREIVRVVSEALMELEVEQKTGAAKYERNEGRTNHDSTEKRYVKLEHMYYQKNRVQKPIWVL